MAVASWLVRSTFEGALRVRVLAGDIVLCSWARHLTLTVPLSTRCINRPFQKRERTGKEYGCFPFFF